jgi:glucose/arabinose dehydrogenase
MSEASSRMLVFADGLNFPTSLTFAADGSVYVAESGLPFGGAPPDGAIYRLGSDGSKQQLLAGLRAPVNGLLWHDNSLIISEGGHPGRIVRFALDSGECRTLVDGLPGFGNYHTNMTVLGPDGKLYFSQGAMTNSAIMGNDSVDLAWLQELRHNADIPGYDIELSDMAATVSDRNGEMTSTGAFAPLWQRPCAGHAYCRTHTLHRIGDALQS